MRQDKYDQSPNQKYYLHHQKQYGKSTLLHCLCGINLGLFLQQLRLSPKFGQ